MLWRAWSFASGLPLGAFAAIAWARDPATALTWAPWGALAGGLLLALATTLLARWRDDEPERGRHLAMAASAGWLAVPAGLAWWLGFAPGRTGWLALCAAVLGLALWRGARTLGPAGGLPRQALRAALYVTGGALAALVIGALAAALGGAGFREPNPRLAALVYDLDAAVATRALPSCAPEPEAVRVLLERGAHPSLSPDGRVLWFDAAPEGGGARQIHRLERASGEVACWTCGEPGNNVRPHAGDTGLGLVFDSDRHASWLHPDDTDVYLASTKRAMASRRLTFRPGPDERALLGPGARLVVWSRREGGRYEVVSAAVRSGHGGILLGEPGVLARGGAEWIAPLAWASDARTLVVGRGNPFAPLAGVAFDPATGEEARVGEGLAPAASFTPDGGWLAFATAQGGHWGGAFPGALGFALGPHATALALDRPLLSNTVVRSGPTAEAAAAGALALPAELAGWGEPTGLALEPDGAGFVLGQRRAGAAGVEERLVEVTLSCGGTALARVPEAR